MSRLFSSARTILYAGAAFTALTAAPAFAQDTATETQAEAYDGEIVVTARRREESLQDVPIAVTAFSGKQLEQSGAIDITDIAATAPNVTMEVSRGTNSTLSAFIRGVGQQDPVAGFEAGVGIYLDDVYLNRPQAAVMDIYDVERIEVLRGPQGTLYGRNTVGGAVKYVTRRIGNTPTFAVRGTYGSYNQADLVVSGSAPVGGGFKIGGAVARLTRDGFGENLTTGEENYNKNIWAARGTLEFAPDHGNVYIRLSGDYTKDKSNTRGGHRLIAGIATGIPVLGNVYDTRGALLDPKQDVEAYGGSLFVELKPSDWLTFRSITGYRKDDSGTPIDFDALASVNVDVPAYYNNKQFSQEAQFLINAGNFNGLVGLYYLDATADTVFDVRLPGGVTAQTLGAVKTDTVALFADLSYDFGEMFSVSVGGRQTWDHRNAVVLRRTYLGGGSPIFGGTGTLFATTSDFRGDAHFSNFTPRASLTFRPSADHTLYASWSQGFKGGGFDPRGQTSACRTSTGGVCSPTQVYDFMSFQPETVDTYEIGYKATLFDRRLNFAAAVFNSDYKDVQVPGSIGTMIGGQQTFIGITTNAAKARIRGVEFEGNAVLVRSEGSTLTYSWSLGYLDAKYLSYIDSRGLDVADRRAIQNTPDWTASSTLTYSVPVASGDVTLSGTAAYRGKSQQFELATPMLDQGAYTLFDANLVWNIDKRFSIGVHGRNLTDERYVVAGYNFLAQNPDTGAFLTTPGGAYIPTLGNEGVLTAYYGNPRQIFVTGSVKF
jgi:iron complex outermembrane receptor protein